MCSGWNWTEQYGLLIALIYELYSKQYHILLAFFDRRKFRFLDPLVQQCVRVGTVRSFRFAFSAYM